MTSISKRKFDLDEYLKRQSAIVDRALEHYLGKYSGASQTIFRAMRYGIFPGGKRIRPILTLAAGELFDAKQDFILPFACAVEMIHAYSLIHDASFSSSTSLASSSARLRASQRVFR